MYIYFFLGCFGRAYVYLFFLGYFGGTYVHISNFFGIFWKNIIIFIFSFWDILSFTGAVCISLGVSEKFQVVCCQDPTHGLIYGGTPATLNRRIMEEVCYL